MSQLPVLTDSVLPGHAAKNEAAAKHLCAHTSALNIEGLYALALSGNAGYQAAALRDGVWEEVCTELSIFRSAYDKCWLDAFSRSLRQCVYRHQAVAPWTHSSKVVVQDCTFEKRSLGSEWNVVATHGNSTSPWFTYTCEGDLYVYSSVNGSPYPRPPAALLTAVRTIANTDVAPTYSFKPKPVNALQTQRMNKEVGVENAT